MSWRMCESLEENCLGFGRTPENPPPLSWRWSCWCWCIFLACVIQCVEQQLLRAKSKGVPSRSQGAPKLLVFKQSLNTFWKSVLVHHWKSLDFAQISVSGFAKSLAPSTSAFYPFSPAIPSSSSSSPSSLSSPQSSLHLHHLCHSYSPPWKCVHTSWTRDIEGAPSSAVKILAALTLTSARTLTNWNSKWEYRRYCWPIERGFLLLCDNPRSSWVLQNATIDGPVKGGGRVSPRRAGEPRRLTHFRLCWGNLKVWWWFRFKSMSSFITVLYSSLVIARVKLLLKVKHRKSAKLPWHHTFAI